MAVRRSRGRGKNSANGIDLESFGASIEADVNIAQLSRGPAGQTLLIDGRYPGISGEPEAIVRVIDHCKNLIRGQALLGVYGTESPVLKPTQAASGSDPNVTLFIYEERVDLWRSKTFIAAEVLHVSAGQ